MMDPRHFQKGTVLAIGVIQNYNTTVLPLSELYTYTELPERQSVLRHQSGEGKTRTTN